MRVCEAREPLGDAAVVGSSELMWMVREDEARAEEAVGEEGAAGVGGVEEVGWVLGFGEGLDFGRWILG